MQIEYRHRGIYGDRQDRRWIGGNKRTWCPLSTIAELLNVRRPFYERADICIDTSQCDVAGVIEQLNAMQVNEAEG